MNVNRHGKWIKDRDTLKCSECGFGYFPASCFFGDGCCKHTGYKGDYKFNFCPDCGAEMRESGGVMNISDEEFTMLDEVVSSIYNRGIKDGSADVKMRGAYEKGLEDAWECARRIILGTAKGGIHADDLCEIFGTLSGAEILESVNVDEAMQKIEKYEERQKQDAKEEIKVGDEVINGGGVVGVVTHVRDIENGMKAFSVVDEMGKVWNFNDLVIKRTGRNFPQIAEVLKLLRGEE